MCSHSTIYLVPSSYQLFHFPVVALLHELDVQGNFSPHYMYAYMYKRFRFKKDKSLPLGVSNCWFLTVTAWFSLFFALSFHFFLPKTFMKLLLCPAVCPCIDVKILCYGHAFSTLHVGSMCTSLLPQLPQVTFLQLHARHPHIISSQNYLAVYFSLFSDFNNKQQPLSSHIPSITWSSHLHLIDNWAPFSLPGTYHHLLANYSPIIRPLHLIIACHNQL